LRWPPGIGRLFGKIIALTHIPRATASSFYFLCNYRIERRESREIYDSMIDKAERILSAMKESGQAIRESAWRIVVESWPNSRDYIKPHIKRKVSPNSSPFLLMKR
jgi:hypothetical protein